MINLGQKKVLNIPINACDYEWVTQTAVSNIKKNHGLLIFPLATHTLIEAYLNDKLKKILLSYDILTPDSQWLTWSLKWLYGINLKGRVYGPDLMLNLIAEAEKQKIVIFFFGTNDETLFGLMKNIKSRFKTLNIAGFLPAPFHDLDQSEKKDIIQSIQGSKAKIVFISLSSPKQVILAYELFELIGRNIIMFPVGAGFDFIAGTKKQAPNWMQNHGLEWFFRVIQEPQRLWWRYLKTGSLFLLLVLLQKIQISFESKRT